MADSFVHRSSVSFFVQRDVGPRGFSDDVTQVVVIESVDEEGFCHSGPEGTEPNGYWTRLEDVLAVADE